MKKLSVFLMLLFGACISAESQEIINDQPETILVLDSVYDFSWQNAAWNVKTKNYKHRDNSGNIFEDVSMKINPLNNQWSNYFHYLYNYQGNPYPVTITGEYWTLTGEWVTSEYTHNIGKNTPDESFVKIWNTSKQKFTGGTRSTYTYSVKNLTQEVMQGFDTVTNNWVNSTKYTYEYNPANMVTAITVSVWNGTTWTNNYRSENQYDPNNHLIQHVELTWDESWQVWVASTRTTNILLTTGKFDQVIIENWNNFFTAWDTIQKTNYTYNYLDSVFNVYSYKKDQITHQWSPYTLTAYSYYPNGIRFSQTIDEWDPVHSSWLNTLDYSYDSVGQLINGTLKYIDYQTYTYIFGSQQLISYTSFSKVQEIISKELQTTGDWKNRSRETNLYNENKDLTENLKETWTTDWENSAKTDYYYNYPNGIDDIRLTKGCLFPNPMKAGTALSCPELDPSGLYRVTLVNFSGNRVWEQFFRGGETINTPQTLHDGMYVLTVSSGGRAVITQKVIITR